jgi:hypothetical protein
MRRLTLLHSIFAAILLAAVSALGQTYKAETAPAPAASDLPAKISAALEPQGGRLMNAQGKTVVEIWLRKSLTAQAQSDTSMDVIYGALAPGTLVGVLHFPADGADFRGQPIKAGYYTLRYELAPQDGNHMGVSVYRDFLLMIPAAQDPGPDQILKFDQVVNLSRAAAGTGHPAVLVMDPVNTSDAQSPAAFQDDSQNWALQLTTELAQDGKTKNYPLAVVLVGKYQG